MEISSQSGHDAPRLSPPVIIVCTKKDIAKVPVLDTDSWPTAAELQLDDSQYQALQSALTKEFVLIQGPPGTGKTFIGLKIVEILLQNQQVWNNRDRRPILVVCYTNHALDQFLEGILNFFHNPTGKGLIRVGGRSSSENARLQGCMLNAVRRKMRDERILSANIRDGLRNVKAEMDELSQQIEYMSRRIELLRKGIIHEYYLQKMMAPHQLLSLCDRAYVLGSTSHMVDWLVGSVFLGETAEAVVDDKCTNGAEDNVDADNTDDDDDEEVSTIDSSRKIEDEEDNQKLVRKQLKAMDSVPELALSEASLRNKKNQQQPDGWQTVQGSTNRKVLSAMKQGLDSQNVMSEREVCKVIDVWELSHEDRWRLYRLWLSRYYEENYHYLHTQYLKYNDLAKRRKEYQEEEDYHVIRKSTVIGMTTTGAAKFRAVLQRIQPKIVIVEEAAEVFEAHIVTTLSQHCEQLLLIGDHQQLRPSPTVYKLAKDYHLDVSLFERMVKNEMACDRLSIQHRMRPEIAKLIVPHVYKELYNHESVLHYDHVMGVAEDIFLIEHTVMEEDEEDTRSHSNVHEAEYLVALCQYLLQQGYKSTEITILTTYTGQMFNIRSAIRKKMSLGTDSLVGIRVTPVDNYQGEENEVILLSLVRSNAEGRIGFLKVANRVCVALSRAKKGFYAIGNMKLLSKKSILWNQIVEDLKKENRVGEALCLMCQNHPETTTLAKTASDFARTPDGGCSLPCGVQLDCGHVCTRKCHPTDRDHRGYKCMKPCLRRLCESSHQCPKLCHEDCGPCLVAVEKTMTGCGHLQNVACHQDVENVECNFIIPDREWPCGHLLTEQCRFTPDNLKCTLPVEKKLPGCEHFRKFACSASAEEVDSYKCREPVRITCQRGHMETVNCCDRASSKCQVQVEVSCKYEETHSFPVKCFEVEDAICPAVCQKELPCGHPCSGQCGECHSSAAHMPCQKPCSKLLPCRHPCEGRCGEICKPCSLFPCPLRCAHKSCQKRCGYACQRCNEPCQWECKHQKCRKKCHEKCDRRPCSAPCPLKLLCGHWCAGLCGEPCPTQCKICHAAYYKELEEKSGLTFKKESRLVVVQPCCHPFEVGYLDMVMRSQKPGSYPRPPHVYKCPICESAITFCPRYGNVIKESLREVDAVKRQIDGMDQCKMRVNTILRMSGLAKERHVSSRLTNGRWLRDNTKLVQMVLGCYHLLEEIGQLKIKAGSLITQRKNQQEQAAAAEAKRLYTEDEASVERLELLLKESHEKLRDRLQILDAKEMRNFSEELKMSYLTAHMRVMLLSIHHRDKRECLYQCLHPKSYYFNTRITHLRRLSGWSPHFAREEVNDDSEKDLSVEPDPENFITIANTLKLQFKPWQRNDVQDFLAQVHEFFHLPLDGITSDQSRTWMICHRGNCCSCYVQGGPFEHPCYVLTVMVNV